MSAKKGFYTLAIIAFVVLATAFFSLVIANAPAGGLYSNEKAFNISQPIRVAMDIYGLAGMVFSVIMLVFKYGVCTMNYPGRPYGEDA